MKVLNTEVNTADNLPLFMFTQGLDVDRHIYRQEIQVQKAWAEALSEAGHLNSNEKNSLLKALDAAQKLIEEEKFDWQISDEDIHMNLERFLTQELGELGKKIHLGRSRNDLIASTLRLYVRDEIVQIEPLIKEIIKAIKDKSMAWMQVLCPGMTHMQFGQPIRYGHLFSAHGFSLKRDLARLEKNKNECVEVLPLGAAAFAGTHLNIDLKKLADSLGFQSSLQHSYDAVSDRDYMLSTLQSFALIGLHLSRMCEDIMFWSSSGIKVIKLPYDWSTGSSIMPNKRNPDVPELVRAKMARVIAASQEGLLLMRSVTPSYGSDIHELKRTFQTAIQELGHCLLVLRPFIQGLQINEEATNKLLNQGHILATDVANDIAKTKTFREAYAEVAALITEADKNKQQIHEYYKLKNFEYLQSVESRSAGGGTSLDSANKALKYLDIL